MTHSHSPLYQPVWGSEWTRGRRMVCCQTSLHSFIRHKQEMRSGKQPLHKVWCISDAAQLGHSIGTCQKSGDDAAGWWCSQKAPLRSLPSVCPWTAAICEYVPSHVSLGVVTGQSGHLSITLITRTIRSAQCRPLNITHLHEFKSIQTAESEKVNGRLSSRPLSSGLE